MAAKKGVIAAASAKRLHSNALLSACVKENVPQTDQKHSHVACISTEQVMQKCVILLVFAISLL